MRRYFSIFVVALVALFTATSCQLEGGTEPDLNRANRLLWGRVNDALYQHHEHFLIVAQLNDTLLGKEYGRCPYPTCDITEKDGVYTIFYSQYNRTYRIKTDNKRLDEGGVWSIYVRYGSYGGFIELGKAEGVVGESSKFNLSITTAELGAGFGYAYCYSADSEVEYEYDDIAEGLTIRYNTVKGILADEQLSASDDYIVEFEVVEPLIIRATIESGKVDILYRDLVNNTSRSLTVEIVNKITTFAPKN
ncbi:MAG: hypothetical protein IJD27_00990 [Alistipes sp.]|nr:hypothetical protein [Alistipes sp.]